MMKDIFITTYYFYFLFLFGIDYFGKRIPGETRGGFIKEGELIRFDYGYEKAD